MVGGAGGRPDGSALSGAEIAALLSGNTAEGPNFIEFYDANGAVRGREKSEAYSGSWRVDGDKLCVDFPSYSYKDCIAVMRKDGTYEFVGGDRSATVTVKTGNSAGL
jgi:hypothetical protein